MEGFILRYWIEVLFTGILGILTFVIKRALLQLKEEMKCQVAIRAGMQAILRDRILQAYHQYTRIGYCGVPDRENLKNMYDQYHALGANGVIDGLVEEVMSLPVYKKNSLLKGYSNEEG